MAEENRKQKIIKIANQLFTEKGYTETTMTEIADRSGISRRTLFRIFPRKQDLLVIGYNSVPIDEWINQQPADKELVQVLTDLLKEQIMMGGTDLQKNYQKWFETLNVEPDTRSVILQKVLKQMPLAVQLLSKKYSNISEEEIWITIGSLVGVIIAAWAKVSDDKGSDPLKQINQNLELIAKKLSDGK